jgi:hypothetical protein
MPNERDHRSEAPHGFGMTLKPDATLQEKTDFARVQRDRYAKLAAAPEMSPEARAAAHQLARSCGAAVILYERAIEYERQLNDRESHAKLMRSLGIRPLLDNPD